MKCAGYPSYQAEGLRDRATVGRAGPYASNGGHEAVNLLLFAETSRSISEHVPAVV